MNTQKYEELKEMLCRELEEITDRNELTAGSLETIDKLTHSLKCIDTIIAMEEAGQSNMYPYMRSYAEGGQSNRRGQRRDSMGRYSSRNNRGYSRDDARADMVSDLYALMQDAPDEQTRRKLQRFIGEVENA